MTSLARLRPTALGTAFAVVVTATVCTPALAQTAAPSATSTAGAPRTGGAAATLPNTFDGPARTAAPSAQEKPTPPAAPAAPERADPAVVARAETALKATIAAMQAGAPNYADMTPALADKVRPQAGNLGPLIQGFGAVQSLTYVGQEERAQMFLVVFENQETQWLIGQAEDGKIAALLFRPAPQASVIETPAASAVPAT